MKQLIYLTALLGLTLLGCDRKTESPETDFVSVEGDEFMVGDSVYRYVGTNLWYGAILGSEGRGGDRQRLLHELDTLQALGLTNLRVLVGADGEEGLPSHIEPVLQLKPGVYNDTILTGLDFLLSEMARRDMRAVLYLNNAWEWSGGYSAYLQWVKGGRTVNSATDGYPRFMEYCSQFVENDSAKSLFYDHVRNIVSRTNSITGQKYVDDPTIMAWQVANEPRAFSERGKEALLQFIDSTARLIHQLDPNHLVSTGSEGSHGCEEDLDLWARIHALPSIDYGILHLWPYNWAWTDSATLVSALDTVYANADRYILAHANALPGKPLVLEEFGYPRDAMAREPGSPTSGRDRFYAHVFGLIRGSGAIKGCNFWGWGGLAEPPHAVWQRWDPYTGDPAQEPQGLNSVFAADTTTLAIIKQYSLAN